jgi:hypothetical protein
MKKGIGSHNTERDAVNAYAYSSVCTWRAPNGVRNGGLPISILGSHLSLGRCEKLTTRTTIVVSFWRLHDNAILILVGAS